MGNFEEVALQRQQAKRKLLAGAASILGTLAFLPASAQAQMIEQPGEEAASTISAGQPAEEAGAGQAIVVTGSRIVRDGYDAPTPVSVISSAEINAEAPANISDFVNTLPAVRGSETAASSNGALSNGGAGVNTVNLRSLGANRTLVLVDGQRSVASTNTGSVDVNTIPQNLIERVEVVTGGASSVYGSDAVSGVVNFILNKTFTGLDAEYEYGVTTYGDGPNHKISLTAGTPFGDDRGHIIVSGEYFTQDGIQSIDRDWNETGFFRVNNPQYNAAACADGSGSATCYPEYLVTSQAGASGFTPGGLIVSGPLRGTNFGTIDPASGRASVNQLAYGAVAGQWMVGGDYKITSAAHNGSATLLPSEDRGSIFTRLSWEFSPALHVFGQFAYSYYNGQSYYQQTPTTQTIRADNAFLPSSVASAMAQAGVSTISVGTNNVFIEPQGSDNTREVYRYVVGADGEFDVGDLAWNWDAYYQRGITKTKELLTNAWNLRRYELAIDAVVAPPGNSAGVAPGAIVCRSTLTDPTNGCAPLNIIGIDTDQREAVDYLTFGGLNPLRHQRLTQDVAALNFSTGELFELPAGAVSLAFGGEYRKEYINGTVDPLFQPGFVDGRPINRTWTYGNYLPNTGSYDVKEGFIETLIPIIDGIDFSGAFRLTDYSTSGVATTWKAGLNWQVIDDIRLRGTVSRDIRAPNLSELFAPGAGATNAVNRPLSNGSVVSDQYINSNVGNLNLTPEIARTYGLGAIFNPGFLPGFAASIDYFKIDLSDAISSLTAQTIVDQCYLQGVTSSCAFVTTNLGSGVIGSGDTDDIISVDIQPLNFVSIMTSGLDFEMSYRRPVGPGDLTLRALASYAIEQKTDNGLAAVTDQAGQNTGNLPEWTYRFSADYALPSGFRVQGIVRGVSSGVYDNNYISCTTACPISTVDHRTINYNKIDGALYVDLNASYRFDVMNSSAEAFLAVRNLLNEDPVLVANGPFGNNTGAYPQTNRALFDVLGRVFRLGIRFEL